jgi:hypothetical protein
MTVNIALRRQMWQLDYFTEGSIRDALIGVPTSWTPDQIKKFQDYWDTEFAGDLAKRRRAKFVPGEAAAKVVQTKERSRRRTISTNGSRALSAWLIQHLQKCARWSVIFFKSGSRAAASVGQGSARSSHSNRPKNVHR